MSDLREKTEELAFPLPAGFIDICGRFERAWKEAVSGGPRPQLETFLHLAGQKDRLELHSQLAEIEKNYQQQVSGHVLGASGMTVAFEQQRMSAQVAVHEQPGDQDNDGTLAEPGSAAPKVLAPDTAHDTGGGTIEFQPMHKGGAGAGVASPAGPGDTMGFVPAKEAAVSGDHTIDVQPANPQLGETIGAAPSVPEEGGKKWLDVPGYEILGELGRGAMGVVYKARQKRLNRLVALKMMLAGSHAGPEQLARFQTEAESVARLQNPNIVQIYEVGEHDDLPFFSLEFVDGGTLANQMGGKPQPPRNAAQMIETLARAMDCAHQLDIIHRDLKPANILLTANGILKISDFGLAKRLEAEDSSQTRSGTLMGTPSYMSPEQAHGDTHGIGPPADQYALGVMLYEMLTGRPPFQGTSILDTLEQVRTHEPVPPSRLQPTVPRDLETICLRCLQKEPRKRYAGTSELAEDLRRFQFGEPILARPVGKIERVWRWCKRNPKIAGLSGIVAALLVVVSVFLVSSFFRAAREQKAIDKERQLAEDRFEQATAAIRVGDQRQAQALLDYANPLLESAEQLREIRDRLAERRSQVQVLSEFKKLVDDARFASRFGSRRRKQQAQQQCRKLVALHEEISQRTGKGAAGLPPLSSEQEQLFKEDVFEAYLIAALLEAELARDARGGIKPEAARRAIDWLDRADAILPGTRVVHANRAPCWAALGNAKADELDIMRAKEIVPTLAVDHFYHGFAHHLRANAARYQGKLKDAEAFFHKEIAEYAAVLQLRQDNFWAYFNWAATQFELGNLRDAQIGFTACIRVRPDFPWPYNNRGTIHHRLGENDQAVQDYDKALALDPEYVEACTNRGLAYFKLGKFALAAADLERAIQINPDYAPAHEYLAEVHYARKEFAATIKDFTRLLPLTADKGPLYLKRAAVNHQLGHDDNAVADCTQVLILHARHGCVLYGTIPLHAQHAYVLCGVIGAAFNSPSELARFAQNNQALYDRAGYQYKRRKYVEAADDYARLLTWSADKDKGAIYLKLAAVHHDMGRSDEAIEDCTRALKLDPKNAQAFYTRAHFHLGRKDYLRARDDYTGVLALYPASAPTRTERATLNWVFLRDFDASLADWQELKRLRPKSPEPHYSAGVIHLGRRKYAEAIAALQTALTLKPDHSDAASALAQAWAWQGDLKRALDVISPIVEKLSTEKPETLTVRGDIHRALGRLDEAAADYRRLIELKPDWPETYVSLALVFEKQGKADPANECYERLVAANPGSARVYLRRAEFHRAHGRFAAALDDCARAREKDSKSVLPGLVEASVSAARGADEDAITKAERLLAQATKEDGHVLYAAACVWSLAAQAAAKRSGAAQDLAKKYAERAIELLEQCLDKGFHDLLYPEHNRMADDPALESIRRHPRAHALLAHRG